MIKAIFPENPTGIENFIEWYSDDYGYMLCFMAFTDDVKTLGKYSVIKDNIDKDAEKAYIEFEVSYSEDKALREVHMLIQELIEGEWTDPELVGAEIKDMDDCITGHTLLTSDEYYSLISMAEKALPEALLHFADEEE